MSMTCRRHASCINMACAARPVRLLIGLALLAAPVATFADLTQLQNICTVAPDSPRCKNGPLPMPNLDCTLVVPDDPLTAGGLATPYQLVATNPADGACHEADPNQSAFVEAAILDPKTGRLSIYRPLVIDQGTTPAAAPVVPHLPDNAVVGLWFGYNGMNLALEAAEGVLEDNNCVQGLAQFAYCNAPAFFAAVHDAINGGRLRVPPLGTWTDADGNEQPCPSAQSWDLVDQDQSDNLYTTYLLTADGQLAQDTAENMAQFPVPPATVLTNPSDERLLGVFMDPALGCMAWEAPDLTNPGHTVPALALNELQAGAFPPPLFFGPPAWIPLGDPFAQAPPYSGNPDLGQVNAYRLGVDQPLAANLDDASTTAYCRNLVIFGIPLLQLERPFFVGQPSPAMDVAVDLWTFMLTRFSGTYMLLNENRLVGGEVVNLTCMDFLGGLPNPVSLTMNADGVVIAAEFNFGVPSQDPPMQDPEKLF
jgi:hypothetical protein